MTTAAENRLAKNLLPCSTCEGKTSHVPGCEAWLEFAKGLKKSLSAPPTEAELKAADERMQGPSHTMVILDEVQEMTAGTIKKLTEIRKDLPSVESAENITVYYAPDSSGSHSRYAKELIEALNSGKSVAECCNLIALIERCRIEIDGKNVWPPMPMPTEVEHKSAGERMQEAVRNQLVEKCGLPLRILHELLDSEVNNILQAFTRFHDSGYTAGKESVNPNKLDLNVLADQVYEWAESKGWNSDDPARLNLQQVEILGDCEDLQDYRPKAIVSYDISQLALMGTEIAEAIEGIRNHNPPSDHIPDYTLVEEELADVIIRVLHFARKRKLRIADAVIAKMLFNETRPYKHGKLA